MPVYKYQCEDCGHTFEDLRGFNDSNPEACPACDGPEVRRLISGGNFQLKGDGWYATDYADSAAAPADADADDGDSGGDEAA
ncbi:MAG: FmdB family zinc ribbon protein [Persicimonas sp.]